MITEDYVSFETAKLLKEKGFKGECLGVYFPDGRFYTFDTAFDFNPHDGNLSHPVNAPTLQMTMKWLREIHKLWCEISWEGKNAWFVDIFSLDEEQYVMFNKIHNVPSYEEACEAAVRYCLENLI